MRLSTILHVTKHFSSPPSQHLSCAQSIVFQYLRLQEHESMVELPQQSRGSKHLPSSPSRMRNLLQMRLQCSSTRRKTQICKTTCIAAALFDSVTDNPNSNFRLPPTRSHSRLSDQAAANLSPLARSVIDAVKIDYRCKLATSIRYTFVLTMSRTRSDT